MQNSHLFASLIITILISSCAENINNSISVIAHRGGANLAPENTLAAFSTAMNMGVDLIEIDVVLTKDEHVIVLHDKTIDRTTNGTGIAKEMYLPEIKRYDAGSWFDDKFLGEKIPTLEEVLELVATNIVLLVEIKGGDEEFPGIEKRVVDIVEEYNAEERVIIQSFNENTVLRVKTLNPNLKTFYLLGRNFQEFFNGMIDKSEMGEFQKLYDGLAPHYSLLDSQKVLALKELDFSIYTWTVNDQEHMKNVIDLNVDGIITDSPDLLIKILSNRSQ